MLVEMIVGVYLVVLAGLASSSADDDFHFGYDGESGPDHWADHFNTCAGKYQSPINIDQHLVQTVQLLPLKFTGFADMPVSTTLTNNGHTVKIELKTSTNASVSGGPLKAEYVFSQMHFHWGYNDTFGSEDLINNHSYPMELHMVSFKSEYGSESEAGNHDDGLTVMAFFFEVSATDNEEYSDIVAKLQDVLKPDQSVNVSKQRTLNALMGDDRSSYYTYHGSLTTPPCSEVVTWIDFTKPILLSHSQLEEFRHLQTTDGPMTHNNRPTQPLGGRLVWYNERERHDGDASTPRGTAMSSTPSHLLHIAVISLAFSFVIQYSNGF